MGDYHSVSIIWKPSKQGTQTSKVCLHEKFSTPTDRLTFYTIL